jgi:hypothetical protein
MKLKFTIWILITLSLTTYGQNVGIGTSSPNALLDVSATNNGILIPRVALTGTGSASPLTSPTTSTLVYNTATVSNVTPGFYYWNGSAWVRVIDNNSLTGATTVSNTSSANTLSTTVNGVTGTGVNIINSNALSMSGNTLSSTINSTAPSTQSLSGLSLSGDVTGTLAGSTVGKIQSQPVSATTPTSGQVLEYVGSTWTPTSPTLGTVTSIATTGPLTGGPITGSGTIGCATCLTTGTISGLANPSTLIGMSVTNGSGTTAMYANAAPAINPAIVPTWTGTHTFSNATYSALFTGGNVGIGTATPGYVLEVAGNTSIGGKALAAGMGNEIWTQPQTNGNAVLYINYRGYADGATQFRDLNISNGKAANIAFFQGSTSNVGIGTITPAHTLDVVGDINTNTGFTMSGAATSGNYLRGNGTNFVSSAIQPSDIPSGSGNYIQNGTTAQTANYNITGNGTLGGTVTSSLAGGGGAFYASSYSTSAGYAQYVGNWADAGTWGIGPATGSSTDNTVRIGNCGATGVWSGTQNLNLTVGGSITTPGYFFNTNTGINQIVLNAPGADYGVISNPTTQVWSLGYSPSPTTLATSVLSWTPSGNVGIGTTTPSALLQLYNGDLHVEGTSTGSSTINYSVYGMQIGPISRTAGAGIYYPGIAFNHLLNYSGTTYNVAPQAWIGARFSNSAGSELDYLTFATKSGTGTSGAGNDIPVERMCIDPTGNVGIGTTAPNWALDVKGTLAYCEIGADVSTLYFSKIQFSTLGSFIGYDYTGNERMVLNSRYSASHYEFQIAGTTQLNIASNGACTALSFTASSDIRYKKDITPLKNSLEKVSQMQGVYYYWKMKEFPGKFNDKRQIGFIAQDLEKIYPELVLTGEDGYKSVDYGKVTPILVEAIKELKEENKALKSENAEMIRTMKAQLDLINERLNIKAEK